MAQLNLLDLSHVALNVTNIENSSAFYSDVLGMNALFKDELPGGMGFSSGFVTPSGVMVELIQITGLEIQARELTSTIAFSVSSLEAAKEALHSEGIEIHRRDAAAGWSTGGADWGRGRGAGAVGIERAGSGL